MWFLAIGVVLLVLKLAEVDPVAGYSWIAVLAPFGLAVAWWVFADKSGLTRRRAERKMEVRKQTRRERDMKALGLDVRREQRVRGMRAAKPAAPAAPAEERREPRP